LPEKHALRRSPTRELTQNIPIFVVSWKSDSLKIFNFVFDVIHALIDSRVLQRLVKTTRQKISKGDVTKTMR